MNIYFVVFFIKIKSSLSEIKKVFFLDYLFKVIKSLLQKENFIQFCIVTKNLKKSTFILH